MDRVARAGWSVVIEGVLEEATLLSGRKALDHTRAVATEPWAPGTKAQWLRVVPNNITGRRIRTRAGKTHTATTVPRSAPGPRWGLWPDRSPPSRPRLPLVTPPGRFEAKTFRAAWSRESPASG